MIASRQVCSACEGEGRVVEVRPYIAGVAVSMSYAECGVCKGGGTVTVGPDRAVLDEFKAYVDDMKAKAQVKKARAE